MPDLTNQQKIDIMRLAVDADWGSDPNSKDTPITLYHAMIKAIEGSGEDKADPFSQLDGSDIDG